MRIFAVAPKIAGTLLASAALTSPALADAPRVAADVAPVHSLVARVMVGVGEPALVVPSGASPHEYSLRPSEAAALQDADLVFWVGEGLTPWLEDALATLSDGATVSTLLEGPDVTLLPVRDGATFEPHDHGGTGEDEHDHDHDHAHDHGETAAGHDHDHGAEEAASDDDHHDHDHADHAGHDHDHGAHDPHAWLMPGNGVAWLNAIARALSAADPENAATYRANAEDGIAEIEAAQAEIQALLDPVDGLRFIVFHDAYQYFETAFGLSAVGAISLSDATDPSPARIAEIQDRIREEGIDCVLSEPQYNPGLVATVLDGTEAATAVLDPLGSDLETGPELYTRLLRNLAQTLASCS